MPGRLDIAILGPLEVRRDGIPLKLGGASARMLLAVLALRVGEVVSPESLIDLLWGDSAPRAARATIQVYVSRFRKLLRSEAAELALIESRSGGYVLRIDREQIDAHRFDRSVHEGSVALGHGNADAALEKLERALALWRGEPLADLDVPSALRGELNALEELRLRAMETQFEAALATGRHLDFLSSMGTAVKEHPLNERLHALHMVALYRAGRQGEALDVASRMRRTLSQELGIQPSPALATLERQILEQDPSLDPVIPKRPSAVREARKTVVAMTVRVTAAALTGSTLDPEVVHPMTARVAARLNEIVRRHGGLVYETLPTSITVVFGLPSVHEDDAARAVRTAVELRAQLPGATPDGGHIGVRFEVRIALAAGEVLVQRVDEEERLLSSAPIEISAQLSSSAKPSEILLSETAYRLARHDVVATQADLLALPEAAPPSVVYRLVDVSPIGAPGRLRSALVGREAQVSALREVFNRVIREGSCSLVTVIGPAGVGKSRLVSEFLSSLGARASVAIGRCLPYGQDISLWPIAEILRSLADVSVEDSSTEAAAKIGKLLAGEREADFLTDEVTAVLGISDAAPAPDELFWAIRRLLEVRSHTQPLVLVVEDLHWADTTLLDLLEHISTWASEASILLLCTARPELVETRVGWGGGNVRATNLTLDALSRPQTSMLIHNLLAGSKLSPRVEKRILDAVEGHPLFLEELLGMLIDDGRLQWGDGQWTAATDLSAVPIPVTVQALLASRLDRLPPDERHMLERCSIIGKEFSERDLRALVPPDEHETMSRVVDTLVHKDFVVPDQLLRGSGRSYRFRHILIRDVAYQATLKETRARLHRQLGLALRGLDHEHTPELDEVVGYHLEAACRYRNELGLEQADTASVAAFAADHLAAAGRRAFDQDDMRAASGLLRRTLALLEENDTRRPELSWRLAVALFESGELSEAQAVVERGILAAQRLGNEIFVWRLRLEASELQFWREPESVDGDERLRLVNDARMALETFGDSLGVARAHRLLGDVLAERGQYERAAEAFESAQQAALLAGDEREAAERPTLGLLHGPLPVDRCIEIVQASIERMERKNPESVSQLGHLYGLKGRLEDARRLFGQALDRLEELGSEWRAASVRAHHGWLLLMAGQPAEAEAVLRPAEKALVRMGERGMMSTVVACLARALEQQGKFDEAISASRVSEEASSADDVVSNTLWRCARARVMAWRGDLAGGERLARLAVTRAEESDLLNLRGEAHLDLGGILEMGGKSVEAVQEIETARRLFAQRGNAISTERATAHLERLVTACIEPSAGGA